MRRLIRRPVEFGQDILLRISNLWPWPNNRTLQPTSPSDPRKTLGRAGEDVACSYLQERGYRIVARNVHYGVGEVDIVAQDGETLVFVEVRTRRSMEHSEIGETVTPAKQRRVTRAALRFLQQHPGPAKPLRFDVITVSFAGASQGTFTLVHSQGAFDPG